MVNMEKINRIAGNMHSTNGDVYPDSSPSLPSAKPNSKNVVQKVMWLIGWWISG